MSYIEIDEDDFFDYDRAPAPEDITKKLIGSIALTGAVALVLAFVAMVISTVWEDN